MFFGIQCFQNGDILHYRSYCTSSPKNKNVLATLGLAFGNHNQSWVSVTPLRQNSCLTPGVSLPLCPVSSPPACPCPTPPPLPSMCVWQQMLVYKALLLSHRHGCVISSRLHNNPAKQTANPQLQWKKPKDVSECLFYKVMFYDT